MTILITKLIWSFLIYMKNKNNIGYSEYPLTLYVTNFKRGTLTQLLSNRNIQKVINTIINYSKNYRLSWIEDNIIEFTITEGIHSSWDQSMEIIYNINDKRFLNWDKKTININNGNTYKI